jgi:hypothetical protein
LHTRPFFSRGARKARVSAKRCFFLNIFTHRSGGYLFDHRIHNAVCLPWTSAKQGLDLIASHYLLKPAG